MLEMKLHGVKKFMEATLVVKNITFETYEGDKVGIVGANGSGKSTILKLIAGIEKMHYPGYPQTSSPGYDEGLINLPRGATKAYLEQELLLWRIIALKATRAITIIIKISSPRMNQV